MPETKTILAITFQMGDSEYFRSPLSLCSVFYLSKNGSKPYHFSQMTEKLARGGTDHFVIL